MPQSPVCSHQQDDHSQCAHSTQPAASFDTSALISARGLRVSHDTKTILQDVDLDISAGEIVTLIGPNGAGKTTLVRVLLGVETPDAGGLHAKPGLKIGYVPQRFDRDAALPITVVRFLRMGSSMSHAEAIHLLQRVGAHQLADRQMSRLSGGELQRVLLARAVSRLPDLLVLDEPVRGVDYAGEAELYTLISDLREAYGFGVLMVSHDLRVVMAASDRVVCINRHVCCSGQPTAVAQHPEYARLFGESAARAFAVYEHHHDHSHDLAGEPHDASEHKK